MNVRFLVPVASKRPVHHRPMPVIRTALYLRHALGLPLTVRYKPNPVRDLNLRRSAEVRLWWGRGHIFI